MQECAVQEALRCCGDSVGGVYLIFCEAGERKGLFVFGLGGELLFGVGEGTLRGRRADARPGVGLDGLDLGEDLLLRLAHRRSFADFESMRDYALLLPARGDVRQDCRWKTAASWAVGQRGVYGRAGLF